MEITHFCETPIKYSRFIESEIARIEPKHDSIM